MRNSKFPLLDQANNVLASVPWVAQWRFNNDGNDSIGANHLTNNNSATFAEGKLGGATGATQLVAASSQYWSIASNSSLQISSDMTFLMWINPAAVLATKMLIAKDGSIGAREYVLQLSSSGPRIEFYVNPGTPGASVIDGTVLSAGTWYCIAAWYDSVVGTYGTAYTQVNNGTVYSQALLAAPNVETTAFEIGARAYSGFEWYFDGRIDNVCIAKSAAGGGGVLTSEQRSAFFAAGVGTETLT